MKSLALSFKSSYHFLLPALLASTFGLMVLLSLSQEAFLRQLVFLGAGLLVFYIFTKIPLDVTQRISFATIGVLYLLLVANLLVGQSVRGSVRWLDLGFLAFQPSELVKPFLIVCLSSILGSSGFNLKSLSLGLAVTLPGIALTLLQPDLGTSLALLFVWGILILYSGIKPHMAAMLGALGAGAGVLGFLFGLRDYQKERLRSFLSPESDPLGTGYNVLQSKIAVGSGRFLGKGFGQGSQSHLNFLPESKTDFVFASLAEEWGFLGSILIIGLLGLMCLGVWYGAQRQKDLTKRLIFLGVWGILLFQIFVNIGMNLGIMPVTGIPLPFVSLGGSSLLAFWIMFGVLTAIAKESDLL